MAFAQQGDRVELGSLQTGAKVSFICAVGGEWGIEISNGTATYLTQLKPAQIEIFRGEDNVRQFAAGYRSIQKEDNMIEAKANVVSGGKAGFEIEDRWNISGAVLSLSRKVSVTGTEDSSGFFSMIQLSSVPTVKWEDADYFVPGLFYGDPHTRAGAPGGSLNYNAKRLSIREDYLSAPLFAVLFRDGNWAAVLDLTPNGNTTQEETAALADTPVIDERIQFGALGAHVAAEGGVEFGFWLPGTTNEFRGNWFRNDSAATPIVRHRYNPVKDGFSQSYQVGFRFGKSESFRDMERDA